MLLRFVYSLSGAGKIRIQANQTTVDGFVQALGGDWRSPESGGGSGGSLWIETDTLDGDGSLDVSGGFGYGGSGLTVASTNSAHGGGGAAGRLTIYYRYNHFVGEFVAAGGEGGDSAEHGGPGTVYLHLLPEEGADQLLDGTTYVVTHDSEHDGVHSNRTLYIDNRFASTQTYQHHYSYIYFDFMLLGTVRREMLTRT